MSADEVVKAVNAVMRNMESRDWAKHQRRLIELVEAYSLGRNVAMAEATKRADEAVAREEEWRIKRAQLVTVTRNICARLEADSIAADYADLIAKARALF